MNLGLLGSWQSFLTKHISIKSWFLVGRWILWLNVADCGALFISWFGADAWSTLDGRIEKEKRFFFFFFLEYFLRTYVSGFWFLVP